LKILFSISNGLLSLCALALLLFTLNDAWSSGLKDYPLDRLIFSICIGALYLFNIYSFWRYPGWFLSFIQVLVNLFLIPLIMLISTIALTFMTLLLTQLDPTADLGVLGKFTYVTKFIIWNGVLTIAFVLFNVFKAFKTKKQSTSN